MSRGNNPPSTAELLAAHLAGLDRHVLGVTAGLDEEHAASSVVPSGWTMPWMLHHLAVDNLLLWTAAVIAGDPAAIARCAPDAENAAPATIAEARDSYAAESAAAQAVLTDLDLGAAPAWWPENLFGTWRLETNEQVITHLLVEVATHVGHLDLARELLDGSHWDVFRGQLVPPGG
ncbi:mycothiol transferase [Nocardioides acrostichi]|uniref:DUF664 domain-containing protein n=1 Tax=Nocardioides acrostichi TaxID=2784339 RepID=A0A930UZ17_9ACTN|nr:DUF664 domain-containing protein [Nocardioides acrostichi]MBF4160876.1 DUF664 domain-containing protein [Nocardioides acrostichi]